MRMEGREIESGRERKEGRRQTLGQVKTCLRKRLVLKRTIGSWMVLFTPANFFK